MASWPDAAPPGGPRVPPCPVIRPHRRAREHGARRRHGVDPGRHVPDGIAEALSGGAPGPPRRRRRVLDRSRAGHQRALRPLRRRDRPRHVRRAAAGSGAASGGAAAHAVRRVAGLRAARRTGRPPRLPQLVALRRGRALAAAAGPRQLDRRPRGSSGGPRQLRRRRGVRAVAGQGPADRSRVGVRRPRRPRRQGLCVGRRVPPARSPPRQHLAGRISMAEQRQGRLRADLARGRFRRTATGWSTSSATSGNGRRTGICRATRTRRSRQAACRATRAARRWRPATTRPSRRS